MSEAVTETNRQTEGTKENAMQGLRGIKKGMTLTASSDRYVKRVFDSLSKAAIFDAYCQLVALNAGHPDDAITIKELADDITPTLIARGDSGSISALGKMQVLADAGKW